ncbi:MAG: hypothetical protein IKX25_03475 [Bacteroidales bacterium]|nr:hypothetical protein [Bacteroidales bacterium]
MKLISGVASLVVGAVLYLLFRTKSLLGFELLSRIGAEPWADWMRSHTSAISLPDIIIYALPGGLWALGYILIIDHIYGDRSRLTRIVWAAVIPVLGFGSELLQVIGLLPGTFDPWDLVCYALPYIIYIVII